MPFKTFSEHTIYPGRNNYKEPNPKCRLYWYLIEFMNWRSSQSCRYSKYFQPHLWNIAPSNIITGSPPPHPPCVNKYRSIPCITIYTVYKGGGESGCVWRAYTGVIHCVFDQIPNLQIGLPPQTKRGWGLRQINTWNKEGNMERTWIQTVTLS